LKWATSARPARFAEPPRGPLPVLGRSLSAAFQRHVDLAEARVDYPKRNARPGLAAAPVPTPKPADLEKLSTPRPERGRPLCGPESASELGWLVALRVPPCQ
jgi:hypothetical protein